MNKVLAHLYNKIRNVTQSLESGQQYDYFFKMCLVQVNRVLGFERVPRYDHNYLKS